MIIKNIFKKLQVGNTCSVQGRVLNSRKSGGGNIVFIELVDGSTIRHIQCVLEKEKLEYKNNLSWDKISGINRAYVIILDGILINSIGKGQKYEINVTSVSYISKVLDQQNHPLVSRGHIPISTLHSHPNICGQSLFYTAIQLVKQTLMKSIHTTMANNNIGEHKPTLLTTSECEDGAHPFSVTTLPLDDINKIPTVNNSDKIDISKDFFGKRTYLTVSGQLQLESTVIATCQDGYVMTIAFRAEPSKTPMHMAEFLMTEWECIGDMKKTMMIGEYLIKDCIRNVLSECEYEIEYIDNYIRKDLEFSMKNEKSNLKKNKNAITKKEYVEKLKEIENNYQTKINREKQLDVLKKYLEQEFVYTTHKDCVTKMLEDIKNNLVTFREQPGYDQDLSREHERYISRVLYPDCPGVFVQNLPEHIKAFYMPKTKENGDIPYAECFDFIGRFGEIIGGSARIHDYEELSDKITQFNLKHEDLEWYKDTRKYGCLPHSGAGIGFNRLFMEITGLENARYSEEFLRAYGHSIFA